MKTEEEFMKAVAWDGPTQIIRPDELERYTERGRWTLLATYEAEVPSWDYRMNDRGCEIVGEPGTQQQHGADYGPPVKRSEPFAIRQRFFVIGETRDEMMEKLRKQCGKTREAEFKWRQNFYRAEKAEKKALEDLQLVEDVVGDLRKENRTHSEHVEASTEMRQKMEGDLAKVRNAIGARAWKEILG